jgi:carbon-monoxide dehydrogenase medium subunit
VKPAPFEYVRAPSVAAALTELERDPDAKILAGGQSLMPLLNLRLARPSRLVDIGGLAELDRVFDDEGSVLIGALVRHRRLETDPLLVRRVPLLAEAAGHIGHRGIRNRGTLGGSLAHGDALAELPAVMVTLRATIYAESRSGGRRELPADGFFVGHFTTALEPEEIVTWVRVPVLADGAGWGFVEFARRHGDFALMAAAATLHLDADGRVADVRAVLLGGGDAPWVVSAGDEPVGAEPDEQLWTDCARRWSESIGGEDVEYRRDLGAAALRRVLAVATRRAGGKS